MNMNTISMPVMTKRDSDRQGLAKRVGCSYAFDRYWTAWVKACRHNDLELLEEAAREESLFMKTMRIYCGQ